MGERERKRERPCSRFFRLVEIGGRASCRRRSNTTIAPTTMVTTIAHLIGASGDSKGIDDSGVA